MPNQVDDNPMPDTDVQEFRDQILAAARKVPFFNLVGLEVTEIAPGRSTTRMAWREDLAGPGGLIHGGMIASLIDTGTAYALLLTDELRDPLLAGRRLVTVDLRVKYLRPVAGGRITCLSTATRVGRQIIHTDAIVTDEGGKEVARGDALYTTVDATHGLSHQSG